MSGAQTRTIALLVLLLLLELARSPNVRKFFVDAGTNASASLANPSGVKAKDASITKDWHLMIYWLGAAILLILLSDFMPNVVTAFIALIMLEELLVHWPTFASYMAIPTK